MRSRSASLLALLPLPLLLGALAQCAGPARPSPIETVRFSTFNVALNRAATGQLAAELERPDSRQARAVAEIIQRARPDVLLLNEFDWDAEGVALERFERLYLGVGHNGAEPIRYAYRFTTPVNTGQPSGLDLDADGRRDGPGDALGFGRWPGQYGMVLLSRFPILADRARTFAKFLWRDVPDSRLPREFYDAAAIDVLPVSSKSHWDVPVQIGDRVVHVLACHPTPPVFDGPEDRNGRRNHDEIRLFADYLDPAKGAYLRDDAGRSGALPDGASFVIVGDLNADPADGEAAPAIAQLLAHPRVNGAVRPTSPGAAAGGRAESGQRGDPATHTASWSAGNFRVDYVLPDRRMVVVDAGVFWPAPDDPTARLVSGSPPPSSDHRLVWVEVRP